MEGTDSKIRKVTVDIDRAEDEFEENIEYGPFSPSLLEDTQKYIGDKRVELRRLIIKRNDLSGKLKRLNPLTQAA